MCARLMEVCPGIAVIAADVISRSLIFLFIACQENSTQPIAVHYLRNRSCLRVLAREMSVEQSGSCSQPPMVESRDHSIVWRSGTSLGGGEYLVGENKGVCFYVSMCFLPKRRASTDHAPGPIMAA